MYGVLKKEFKVKKLSLNLEDSKVLKESWILPSWVFMMLRSAMALFCLVIVIVSVVRTNSAKWLIYLTIWSFLLVTVSLLGLSFLSFMHCVNQMRQNGREAPSEGCSASDGRASLKEENESNEATRYIENQDNITDEHERTFHVKLIWLLWIFASANALIVTLLYWTMVFKPPTSFMDISLHALNVIFVLTELLLGTIPVHLLHGLYAMVIACIYAVFTVIYWAAGGRDIFGNRFIYKPLNYENGHPAYVAGTLVASIFVIIPLLQLVIFVLYLLRCYLRKKICSAGSELHPEVIYNLRTF